MPAYRTRRLRPNWYRFRGSRRPSTTRRSACVPGVTRRDPLGVPVRGIGHEPRVGRGAAPSQVSIVRASYRAARCRSRQRRLALFVSGGCCYRCAAQTAASKCRRGPPPRASRCAAPCTGPFRRGEPVRSALFAIWLLALDVDRQRATVAVEKPGSGGVDQVPADRILDEVAGRPVIGGVVHRPPTRTPLQAAASRTSIGTGERRQAVGRRHPCARAGRTLRPCRFRPILPSHRRREAGSYRRTHPNRAKFVPRWAPWVACW